MRNTTIINNFIIIIAFTMAMSSNVIKTTFTWIRKAGETTWNMEVNSAITAVAGETIVVDTVTLIIDTYLPNTQYVCRISILQ